MFGVAGCADTPARDAGISEGDTPTTIDLSDLWYEFKFANVTVEPRAWGVNITWQVEPAAPLGERDFHVAIDGNERVTEGPFALGAITMRNGTWTAAIDRLQTGRDYQYTIHGFPRYFGDDRWHVSNYTRHLGTFHTPVGPLAIEDFQFSINRTAWAVHMKTVGPGTENWRIAWRPMHTTDGSLERFVYGRQPNKPTHAGTDFAFPGVTYEARAWTSLEREGIVEAGPILVDVPSDSESPFANFSVAFNTTGWPYDYVHVQWNYEDPRGPGVQPGGQTFWYGLQTSLETRLGMNTNSREMVVYQLKPSTTYYYRIQLEDRGWTAISNEQSFTTPPA